jgi:hypothetical protein
MPKTREIEYFTKARVAQSVEHSFGDGAKKHLSVAIFLELCKLGLFLVRQSKLLLRQGNFKEISYLKVEAGKSISV